MKVVKLSECLDKECFKPGKDWGHLQTMLCKYIGESKDSTETICTKPRTRFCWECGKQLYGNHHEDVRLPHDDLSVVMHKQCAKVFKKEHNIK